MGGPGLSRGGPESMGVPKSRLGSPITLSLSSATKTLKVNLTDTISRRVPRTIP